MSSQEKPRLQVLQSRADQGLEPLLLFEVGVRPEHETRFKPGDEVVYTLLNGDKVPVVITSVFMKHERAKIGGHEARFPNGSINFCDIERLPKGSEEE